MYKEKRTKDSNLAWNLARLDKPKILQKLYFDLDIWSCMSLFFFKINATITFIDFMLFNQKTGRETHIFPNLHQKNPQKDVEEDSSHSPTVVSSLDQIKLEPHLWIGGT